MFYLSSVLDFTSRSKGKPARHCILGSHGLTTKATQHLKLHIKNLNRLLRKVWFKLFRKFLWIERLFNGWKPWSIWNSQNHIIAHSRQQPYIETTYEYTMGDISEIGKFIKFLVVKSTQIVVQSRLGGLIYTKCNNTGTDWVSKRIFSWKIVEGR